MSRPPSRPRPDAAIAATDPLRMCDRYDPAGCATDQTCDLIVRLFEGDDQFTIYTACVDTVPERALGDPCDPNFTGAAPYETAGLSDPVFRDQCAAGLVCGADLTARGAGACRPACQSGRFGDRPFACTDPRDICVGLGQFQEFCARTEGCDVINQTGCDAGLNCYMRPRDDGMGYVTICIPPVPSAMMVADGEPCQQYNACRPGSSCQGPLTKDLVDWREEDYLCRPACNMDGSILADDTADGGVAGQAACDAPRMCRPFMATGLDFGAISNPPFGQCG